MLRRDSKILAITYKANYYQVQSFNILKSLTFSEIRNDALKRLCYDTED